MDQELQLRNEWAEVESAFLEAKKNRGKDPAAYAAAKAKMHDMRVHWRGIREAVGHDAYVATISTKASTK